MKSSLWVQVTKMNFQKLHSLLLCIWTLVLNCMYILSIITVTHLSAWRGRTLMCCPPCYNSIAFAWTDTDTPLCPSSPPLRYKPYGPDRAGRASSDPETGPSVGCTEAVLQWCTSPVSGWGSWLMTWESGIHDTKWLFIVCRTYYIGLMCECKAR